MCHKNETTPFLRCRFVLHAHDFPTHPLSLSRQIALPNYRKRN
jgi:hypothetical protein